MSNSTLNVDPRIIPIVRSLKEHTTLNPSQNINTNKIIQNITSSKFKETIENEKNKTDEIRKSKKIKTSTITRFPNKSNTVVRKKSSTKISIDGSVDKKMKSGTADNHGNNNNKIKIISKQKEQKINYKNTFHLSSDKQKPKENNYNNIKTKSKYVQNLMSDMSIKKYKQNCIDILKNDNLVKKLYE